MLNQACFSIYSFHAFFIFRKPLILRPTVDERTGVPIYNKMRKTNKKLIKSMIIGVAMLTGINAAAQVNWQLHVGGMYADKRENGGTLDMSGALLLQIPIKKGFFMETGLGWRYKYVLPQSDVNDDYSGDYDFYHFLELPIKAGCKLQLNEKNAFDFGFGPYMSLALSKPEGEHYSSFSAGLNASVAFRHRCMSFGLSWQNPIFKNGLNDHYKNSVMVTVGINIKGRKPNWEKIMDGLNVAGAVLESATQVASSFSDNSSTSETMMGNSSSTNYEAQYRQWEKRAEKHYNSLTNLGLSVESKKAAAGSTVGSMNGGNYVSMKKSFREAQKQMKAIRRRAAKAGVQIPQSKWETATVSY